MDNGRSLVLTASIICAFAAVGIFMNMDPPIFLDPAFGVLLLIGAICGFVGHAKIPKPVKPA